MRFLALLMIAAPLAAQQAAPAAAGAAAKPDEAKTEQKAEAAAESPSPATEQNVSGSIDVGYRWVSGPAGNFDAYRSVVNLGEGPKLFGLDFSFTDPKKRFFDRLDIRANNWGGDPYNTARVDARKERVYDFSFDYRNIAFFNFLPSYANPGAGPLLPGQSSASLPLFLNQRSFDTRRRMIDTELNLRPGTRFVPYLAYTHNSGDGRGVTDFVADSNEYPVGTTMRDKTDLFRGGIHIEMNRYHVTLEQGGTTFKDDQDLFDAQRNPGNRSTSILGQQLFLNSANQAYGIRGDSIFSKAIVTANPIDRLDLYGQFLYSQPRTETNYTQINSGNFVLLNALRFFNGQQDLLSAEAKQPHTSGSIGAEFRVTNRLRIMESWMTDRFHDASSAFLTEQLFFATSPALLTSAFSATGLVLNYNQQQLDVLYDVTSKITLRGGYRYTWGNATVQAPALGEGTVGFTGFENGQLKRHVGLAGLNVRPSQKLNVNLDYEGSAGDRTYFRTSLQDYHRARARARYQLTASLALNGVFTLLDNRNPAPTVDYQFRSRDASLSVSWNPNGGKRFNLLGEYSRTTVYSNIDYPLPSLLSIREQSLYRDNAHAANGVFDVALPAVSGLTPRIAFGGAFFISSGSRPTRYYQPLGRFSLPLGRHVQWNAEWRYYGYSEPFFYYEGFRTHQFMTGLRLSM